MNFMSIAMIASLVLLVPVVGGLLALTPWLMKRNECFAVTIPAAAHSDPRIVALKRAYSKNVVAITAVFTVILVGLVAWCVQGGLNPQEDVVLAWAVVAGAFAPIIISFALMLVYRGKVRAIKDEEQWAAPVQQAAAVLVEADVPSPISLAWNLLYVPIALGTLALGLVLYSSMPEVIPMKMSFSGEVVSTMAKGPGAIAFPVLLVVFMGVVMTLCHWSIGRSKKHVDPAAPAVSALAYGMFARAQSVFLVALGLGLSAVMGVTFVLSSAQVISLAVAGAVVMFVALLAIAGAVVMALVYGQSGSKLQARMQGGEVQDCLVEDSDEHWVLGIIYFNPNDASVFLPKRFGVGWTVNMAKPAAWAFFGGVVLLSILFAVGCLAITGA